MASLRGELTRKAVHVSMGGFALLLRWLTPLQAALLALAALLFNLLALHRLTRKALLREAEQEGGFSWGIVWYPAMVLGLILVFHRRLELAAAVWGLLAFGDGMATVAGVILRGPRLPWNRQKSWAGLCGFLLYGTVASALLVRWTQLAVTDAAGSGGHPVTWIGGSFLAQRLADTVISDVTLLLLGCFAATLAAAFAESLASGLDDNIVVPVVGGATLFAATLVEPGLIAAAGETLGWNFAWGAAVNTALAAAAVAAGGVGRSGALSGWILGTLLYGFGGWRAFSMLLLFFVIGTATTKVGWKRKSSLGIAQERGGRRGAANALANVTTGVVFAFLAVATPYKTACLLGVVAAFATAACDTVSSEIGQAYGRRHFLVTTFRRVAPGTDGAVSLEGTLAGAAAAGFLAAVAWGVGLVSPVGALIAASAAFLGATLESYLGATLERKLVLDNELVNFTNTLVGALLACLGYWVWIKP